jgi:hypothetical protein
MEASDRSGISQGAGVRARSRRLREVRRGYDRLTARHAQAGFRRAPAIPQAMEAPRGQPEIALGRRSYRASRGRRRAMRSLEHADALPAVPRRGDGGLTRTPPFYCETVKSSQAEPPAPSKQGPWVCSRGQAVSPAELLLKKLVEGVARVARITRRRIQSRRSGTAGDLCRGGFASHGHARRECGAIVLLVLDGNAHRYRLHALKAGRRLEVGALLATVQLSPALRAGPIEHRAREKRRRAVVTA